MIEKEDRQIILVCGQGKRINLPELIELEDSFDKKEKESEEQFLGMDEERKRPMSKRAAMALIAGEVLSAMSGPYSSEPIPMIDFSLPENRDIRAEKGSKGSFERVKENKYMKKIKGRGKR